jgi:hypothetical protein
MRNNEKKKKKRNKGQRNFILKKITLIYETDENKTIDDKLNELNMIEGRRSYYETN